MVVLLEHGIEDFSCLMILAQIVTQIMIPLNLAPTKRTPQTSHSPW